MAESAIAPPHTSKPLVETFGLGRDLVTNLVARARLLRARLPGTSTVRNLVSNLKGAWLLRCHSRSVSPTWSLLSKGYPLLTAVRVLPTREDFGFLLES